MITFNSRSYCHDRNQHVQVLKALILDDFWISWPMAASHQFLCRAFCMDVVANG